MAPPTTGQGASLQGVEPQQIEICVTSKLTARYGERDPEIPVRPCLRPIPKVASKSDPRDRISGRSPPRSSPTAQSCHGRAQQIRDLDT